MHILNAAILNSRRVKQNMFNPHYEAIEHPAVIMNKLLMLLEQQIEQK